MIGLRDDEAAVAATEQALPADVLYRLLQIHIRRSESFAKDLKNYLL